jgi:GAF domain-containing protein
MAHTVAQLEKRLEKLERLMDIDRSLSQELDLERLLERTVAEASRVMEADRSSLYVVDRS